MDHVDDNKIIHLYVIDKCDHDCPLCCNNQYDVNKIPVVTVDELSYADTICITGGEPFMYDNLMFFVRDLRRQYPNIQNVYVYTSGRSFVDYVGHGKNMEFFDGINICPKNWYDVMCLKKELFNDECSADMFFRMKSSRIYVLDTLKKEDQDYLFGLNLPNTEIIPRSWQEEFEPTSGIFRRLPILFNDF